MTEAERIKQRYWKRKDAGLCTQCGMEPPKPGRSTCAFCAGKRAWNNHMLRERYKQEHLCQNCGKPVTDGHVKCPECREKQSIMEREKWKEKRGKKILERGHQTN